jgi:hypothetical protein
MGRLIRTKQVVHEPISKLFEEDNKAGKLDKAKEIVGVVLPANKNAALPLNPGEEALAHGVDWRQRAEPRKYVRVANIPGMDDGIAAGKCRERLRPRQAMGIGNRANGSHHARSDYKKSRVRREPRAGACHGSSPAPGSQQAFPDRSHLSCGRPDCVAAPKSGEHHPWWRRSFFLCPPENTARHAGLR